MPGSGLNRRWLLAGAISGIAGLGVSRAVRAAPVTGPAHGNRVGEAVVAIPGASLYVRHMGHQGPAVFLAHSVTGSAHVWDRQLAALADAGYRAIAWSRQGHRGSSGPIRDNRVAANDLLRLADALDIGRFHAVGTAAGSGVMLGLAVDHPDRLHSLTYACSGSNIAEESWNDATSALMPPSFYKLPPDVRELSPEYRAADPDGTARWLALEQQSRPDAGPLGPPPLPQITFAMLREMRMPSLFIAGGADLYAPPALMRKLTEQVPGARFAVIERAGHSAYWEQPEAFRSILLDFLSSATTRD